jgi:hypothetical protein
MRGAIASHTKILVCLLIGDWLLTMPVMGCSHGRYRLSPTIKKPPELTVSFRDFLAKLTIISRNPVNHPQPSH